MNSKPLSSSPILNESINKQNLKPLSPHHLSAMLVIDLTSNAVR